MPEPESAPAATAAPPGPVVLPLNLGWRIAVRVAVALSVVLLFPPWIVLLQAPFLVVFFVPFFIYNNRLLSPSAKNLDKWPALALGMGFFTGLQALLLMAALWEQGAVVAAYFGALAALAAVIVAGAFKACSAEREAADTRRLAGGLISGLLYCFCAAVPFAVIIPSSYRSPIAINEASTAGVLRTLNTAQVVYDSTYKFGFTDSLDRLGPPASGKPDAAHADLVGGQLAGRGEEGTRTSFVKNRYRYTYTPGPRDTTGRITAYTITARPLKRGQTGIRSFFTDQSGVIRATSEERAATATDQSI